MAHTLVIGIGNSWREDDAAGLRVADRIRELQLPDFDVETLSGGCADLVDCWRSYENVTVVDAALADVRHPPGSWRSFDARRENLLGLFGHQCSSHMLGLADAVALSRELGCLPPSLRVYAIFGAHFGYGSALSEAVAGAIDPVVHSIMTEVRPRA